MDEAPKLVYDVIEAASMKSLIERVNYRLGDNQFGDDWKIVGPVVVANIAVQGSLQTWFYQTMVRGDNAHS